MPTAHTTYVALLHKAKNKTAPYGVIFPDFPGCVFAGKTMENALENARRGLIFHIEGMQKSGGKIIKDPKNRTAIPILPQDAGLRVDDLVYQRQRKYAFDDKMEKLGAPPFACAAIEDSLNGVISVKAARIYCIAIPESWKNYAKGFSIADKVIPNLNAINDDFIKNLISK